MNQTCENIGVLPSSLNLNKRVYFTIKRLFDIIFGLIGCILLVPLTLIVKLVYVLSGDFNSIFYKQKRIGKNGNQFYMYKFRTMVPNADKILTDLLKQPEYKKEWDDNQKLNHDPRITRFGRILRKCSIDESPQFFSILIGNMSLIGPRPLIVGEINLHHGDSSLYESVKPGLSGWWAVNGRSATTYKDRLNLEYYYAKNCSLMLDLQIIIRTFKTVWTHEGAK
jgi:undecaprenyl-phosphate galactose phosphotransferase